MVQITDTPLTPEMTPALEALICSELHHPNILATLRYACRPHKVCNPVTYLVACTQPSELKTRLLSLSQLQLV